MNWREQFREDNKLLFQLVGGWRAHVYSYVAVLTFAYQLGDRWHKCEGLMGCSISYLKGIVWSLVWPFYWINYATDFILFHPYHW